MGNGIGKVCLCSSDIRTISCRFDGFSVDKGLGNSICYLRSDLAFPSSSNTFSDDNSSTQMTFRSISGASVSANAFTLPSISLNDTLQQVSVSDSLASFEISTCFPTMPLQPVPRAFSFCKENGFSSSPIKRGLLSNLFDRRPYSSSAEKASDSVKLQVGFSHNENGVQSKPNKTSLKKILRKSISDTIARGQRSIFLPIKRLNLITGSISNKINDNEGTNPSGNESLGDDGDENYYGGRNDLSMESQNLQWAQGKAGEDRVHIVVSEENGWVFVGIYDGFNGPDATDYLLHNIFYAIFNELKELLSNENPQSKVMANSRPLMQMNSLNLKEKILCSTKRNAESQMRTGMVDNFSLSLDKENYSIRNGNSDLNSNLYRNNSEVARKKGGWREIGWRSEKLVIEKEEKENAASISHSDILRALSEALKKTEEAFLKTTDDMIMNNPVLAIMGSCVLVMLMKGEDVYLMNVGDSRAILAQNADCDTELLKNYQQLKEDKFDYLKSIQLTMDHNTQMIEEIQRIRSEHPDDPYAVTRGRVKGCLNVTRAFGASFLKQPKHNDAILETFKVDYVGNSPYINCCPSLHHHRLSPGDRFLILSSDGLYQYFTNEEVVAKVESFVISFPDGDLAQLLMEEVLSRAAQKAGMDFHELLDIRQGERRLYHDDISIVIISLEGKIWHSSM